MLNKDRERSGEGFEGGGKNSWKVIKPRRRILNTNNAFMLYLLIILYNIVL
jgi:hypothetical protein